MLSRLYLKESGITSEVINEAELRGQVVVGGDGGLSSVILTVDGEEAYDLAISKKPGSS